MAHSASASFDGFTQAGSESDHMLEDLPTDHSPENIVEPQGEPERSFLRRSSMPRPRKRQTFSRLSSSSSSPYTPSKAQMEADHAKGDVGLGIVEHPGDQSSFEEASFGSFDNVTPGSKTYSSLSTPFSSASSTARLLGDSPPDASHRNPAHFSPASQQTFADFAPLCPSQQQIWKPARTYVYITLLTLSIFSTLFSLIYLLIALVRPQYGDFIKTDNGNLTPSSATFLFNLFAKLIEVTFLTVFIAFVGQSVSRRAFNKSSGQGITLAEISMRSWIMQPGTIFTHSKSVGDVIGSVMGVLAILATFSAMLYTTACSALVTPQLSPGKLIVQEFKGEIKTDFANVTYIESQCQTPVPFDPAGEAQRLETCLSINLAASSFQDVAAWSASWADWKSSGHKSTDLKQRPKGTALLNENTTVTGQWIEVQDMKAVSDKYGRWVNNVTLAIPHAGVVAAASYKPNKIMQPSDLDGLGAYQLHAAVPAAAINVLCVNMSVEDMTPMVYELWDGVNATGESWNLWNEMAGDPSIIPSWPGPNQYLNETVVDDIFLFGEKYNESRRMPVFPRLPSDYNTILNATGVYTGRDYLWLLGSPPEGTAGYALCGLRASQTPDCSTWYNAARGGNALQAVCEDETDVFRYLHVNPEAPPGKTTISKDWVDLAGEWAKSTTLNSGITDGNASDARTLAMYMPASNELPADRPSIAEALAVMAAGTVLRSTLDTTFDETVFDASKAPVYDGQFSGEIRVQQYASGAAQRWQNLLFLVLFCVAGGNVLVLVVMLKSRGLVTDYCDPANLFALGINSPPSHVFAGSCGGGPSDQQVRARWYLNVDQHDHVYLENEEGARQRAISLAAATSRPAAGYLSPTMATFSRLSKRKSIF